LGQQLHFLHSKQDQPIIADSDDDGTADSVGLFPSGDTFLDINTEFYRSDLQQTTSPSDILEYVLEDMGVPSNLLDTGYLTNELVTNGSFDSDVSGWTKVGSVGTLAYDSGTMKLTQDSGSSIWLKGYQAIPVLPGKKHKVQVKLDSASAMSNMYFSIGTSSPSGDSLYTGDLVQESITSAGTHTFYFTPTASTVYVVCQDGHPASGWSKWDNIVVKAISSFEYVKDIHTNSWSLSLQGALFYKQDRSRLISELLSMSHCTLRFTDKIELHLLSKASSGTLTSGCVRSRNEQGGSTFRKTPYQNIVYDSGHVAWRPSGSSQETLVETVVATKSSTDYPSYEILYCPLVSNSIHAQKLGQLFFQRKYGAEARISFTGRDDLLVYQPEDIITVDDSFYGSSFSARVDQVRIRQDLSLEFSLTSFKYALDDWDDLSPSSITPSTDTSTGTWSPVVVGPSGTVSSGHAPNVLPGKLKVASSGSDTQYIMLDPSVPVIKLHENDIDRIKMGKLDTNEYGLEGKDAFGNIVFRIRNTDAVIAGWNFDTNSLTAGNITLDSSTPAIEMGSATGYMTGTGIWMGNDSGTYKLHIGNPNDKYLKWDGTDLTITGHFIGSSDIATTIANTFTINDDADDVTVQLILDRTTGGAATLSWDGAELTSDATVDTAGSLQQLATKEYVDLSVTSLGASYYMLDTASGVEDYKLCSLTPSGDAETYLESAGLSDEDYIGGWISPVGESPNVLLTGDFNFYLTAEKTTGTKTLKLYWKMYERKSDTSETLIATSSISNEVDSKDTFVIPLVLTSDYEPDSGSRIVGKLYASVTGSGNAPTVRIYYRGSTGSRWDIPANSEVFRSIFVPYDGAVKDVDLGSYALFTSEIGVNTTTPQANVEIEDGGTSNSILLKITQDDGNPYALMIGNDSYSTTDTLGLAFWLDNAGNSYIRNRAAGNLYIDAKGTANTSDIYLRAEDKIYFQDYNSGSPNTKITMDMQNGRLGIGTSPSKPLDVIGQIRSNSFIINSASGDLFFTRDFDRFGVGSNNSLIESQGTTPLQIRAISSDIVLGGQNAVMAIKNAGNVLIGTTTDNAGKLQVLSTSEQLRLEYDNSSYASFTVGSNGTLTLAPTGDFILNPTGNDVYPNTNYDINLGLLTKKFLTLHAAELWVETLVAQDTMATIGGRILVAPTTELTSDLGTGDTTIYVKHNNLANGDRVYLESNGKVEFMSIDSAPGGSGPYSYTVTRNLDGSGANQWYAGDAVLNTGTTGDGFIDIYSVRGVKSSSQYGPTIVGNVRNSSTYNDWTEVWAVGNLNGLYGYGSDTYGAAFGKYSAADYITIDPSNGIRFFDSGDVVQAQLSSSVWTLGEVAVSKSNIQITAGTIKLRTNTTSHLELSTAGAFWAGDTSSTERIEWNSTDGLFIADSSNNKVFQADPSGNVNIAGTVDIGVGAFADLPSDENLVGYWSFDDGTGTVAVDSSGNGNDGTLQNMEEADWVDGVVGKCLEFGGTDEYVQIASDSVFDIQDVSAKPFSICVWVNPTASPSDGQTILGIGTTNHNALSFALDSSEKIWIVASTDGIDWTINHKTTDTINLNEYSFIVLTRDTSGWYRVYINGEEADGGVFQNTSDILLDTYSVKIGGHYRLASGWQFVGNIDECRFYTETLTPSEVKALYLYPAGNRGTRISGNRIRTGIIQSDNYAASAGSMLNLNDGTFKLGGSSTPEFEFDGSNLYVGLQAGEHVKVSPTAVQIKNGATVYTDLTNGVLTLGDSSSGEYILLNGTDGIQMYSGAMQRMRLNIDGSGWFVGANVFSWDTSGNLSVSSNITSASITSSTIDGSIITGGTFRTATSGKKIILTSDGLVLDTGATTGKYGTFKYGDGTKYGSGALAYIHHSAYDVPFYIAAEQTVADFHFYNRASNPSGAAEVGDVCVVNGNLKRCTSAGTPGTWEVTIRDDDNDTRIYVEKSTDEDHIRMDVAGVEAFDLDDDGVLSLPKQSRARAYQSGTGQSISHNTLTKVTLNTKNYDEQNEFDIASNYRFTTNSGGYYLLIGKVRFSSPTTDQAIVTQLRKNGTIVAQSDSSVSGTQGNASCSTAAVIYLVTNDYVELWVWQNSGSSKTLVASADATYFDIHKLS